LGGKPNMSTATPETSPRTKAESTTLPADIEAITLSGDIPNGNISNGDSLSSTVPNGDMSNGDTPGVDANGDVPNTDPPNGDAANGDAANGDAAQDDMPNIELKDGDLPRREGRKRLVVVGLGMVGIAFMLVFYHS
jgi:hypothetical protein